MTMNALSLYVTTTRMVFQADIDDSGAWSDINRLLSYLRQSLTCCVCGHLLNTPMSSTVSSCQHHVCKSCFGGKMRLKPSCSWCKDHSKFIENIQLRILLQCYKQLTRFVLSSPIAMKWSSLSCENAAGSYSGPGTVSGPTTLEQLLEEGASLQDRFNFSEPLPLRSFNRQTNGHTVSVKADAKQSDIQETKEKPVLPVQNELSTSRKVRRGCRCGLATPNPGKLTCCGQRCPCYVENKPCQSCKCRGCRNPNRQPNFTTINIISSANSSPSSSSLISIPPSSILQLPLLTDDDPTKVMDRLVVSNVSLTEELTEEINLCDVNEDGEMI